MFLHTSMGGAGIQAKEHPDWVIRRADGKPHWTNMWMCINSPFRDYQLARLRELLENYEVDGVYPDQLYVSCWCDYCKEKFKKRYGVDMPSDPEDPAVGRFRDDACVEYSRRIRKIINETRPGTIYIQNSVFFTYDALEKAKDFCDAFLPESHFGGGPGPDWLIQDHALYDRLNKAHSGKPVFRNMGNEGHDAKVAPATQIKLLIFDAFLNKTSPTLVDLGRYDFGGRGLKEASEAFGHVQQLKKYVAEAEPLRYCALLHTQTDQPREFTWNTAISPENIRGIYHILTENHIPFELVSESTIKSQHLSKYKVLIVPDTAQLSEETVKGIEGFVRNGGGLVLTHSTGLTEPLASLAGFHPIGLTARSEVSVSTAVDAPKGYFNYFTIREGSPIAEDLKGFLFAFQGNFLDAEYQPDCQIVADILDYDQNKLNMPFYNRRGLLPGERLTPLLTLRKSGQGRVAYFSSEVGAAAWRIGGYAKGCSPELGQLVIEAVKWAGGDLPVVAENVPESVDLAVYYDPKKKAYTILLANLTTNQFQPIKRVKYVVPLANLRLSVLHPKAEVKNVISVNGTNVEWQICNNRIEVTIPELHIYEGVVIELR